MEIFAVSGRLQKMEGIFTGWYLAALSAGNRDAAQIALDLKTDASTSISQLRNIANSAP